LAHSFSSLRFSFWNLRLFISHSTVPGCIPSPNFIGVQIYPLNLTGLDMID
jgi:hypothetical protein